MNSGGPIEASNSLLYHSLEFPTFPPVNSGGPIEALVVGITGYHLLARVSAGEFRRPH